ncbi:MAG: oxidoreductase [Hyphomicrobiales bacterium]|nr:MAG: oxidoreductase [Hyphomicrobiales bacterium]
MAIEQRTGSQEVPELKLTVAALERAADGVMTVSLVGAANEPLPAWEPGAHVDLEVGESLVRQYSLCGDPKDRSAWRLGVLRENPSRGGSAWVHEQLAVGDQVLVRAPRNNFHLVEASSYLFIAGGIGITPLLPMVRTLASRGADWRLVYGGRTEESMAFVDELAHFGDRVVLVPQDRAGLLPLAELLGTPRPDTAVFCCGPEPLIAAVESAMTEWPPHSLHVERFHPRPDADAGPKDTFEVELARTNITVTVGESETIAEALEAAGVETTTSCREGTCGTCETVVLEGEPDHRDSYLTEEEQEDNSVMMICCSRSKGCRLVLDL